MQDYMRDDDFDVTFEFHERKKVLNERMYYFVLL